MSRARRDPATQPTDEPDRGPLIGALLRRCHQALVDEIQRATNAAGFDGLLSSHNVVLRPLWEYPEGVRATELAARARITKQSMGAMIDILERQGYVERFDDPRDGRAKLIRLTKRGREAGRLMRSVVRRVEADWALRIGAARLDALRATLMDLLSSLDFDA